MTPPIKALARGFGSSSGSVFEKLLGLLNYGAGGRTRTDMSLTSPDFESGAYTNFATPAFGEKNNKSCRLEFAIEPAAPLRYFGMTVTELLSLAELICSAREE